MSAENQTGSSPYKGAWSTDTSTDTNTENTEYDHSHSDNRSCDRCGRHVTPGTIRVFGDESGTLHACKQCLNDSLPENLVDGRTLLAKGAGASPERRDELLRQRAHRLIESEESGVTRRDVYS